MKWSSVFLMLLLLAGCAAHHREQTAQVMDTWVGKPVTQAVDNWGPPSTVYDEASYKVYVWHSSSTRGGGSHGATQYNFNTHQWDTVQKSSPVHTSNRFRMFWVNQDGTIAKWKYGNQ
jgi:hypothetical protein